MPATSAATEKLERAIDSYMRNKAVTVGSEKTVVNSAWALTDFRNFFASEKTYINKKDKWDYSDPSFTTVQAWRDALIERGLSVTTVKEYLVRLHTFFEYASDPNGAAFYEKNPVSKRLYPDTRKIAKRPYELPLTNEQIAMLWKGDRPQGCNLLAMTWARNYAIVVLILTSKIRNAELLALTPKDIDWENEEIDVNHGKGNKYRRVPFEKIAQQAMKLYLMSGFRPDYVGDNDPLFGTERPDSKLPVEDRSNEWRPMKKEALSKMIANHVRIITGVEGVTSHDLRHIGAYLDLNSGKHIEVLQAELGHSSPSTTQIYSGRLTSKRNRGSVKLTMQEQEYQILRNNALLRNKSAV